MIRFSKTIIFAALAAVLCAPSMAQDMHSDAFGIVPTDQLSPSRAMWSDLDDTAQRVEKIYFFVGAKSLIAGRDVGHAVAVLIDANGNLVNEGTRAGFTLGQQRLIADTRHGVADILYTPPVLAGDYVAGVTSAGTQSARAIFRVTADLAGITPKLIPQNEAARIEGFATFDSQVLTDQFGNVAPSGLGAQLVIAHEDDSFSIMSPVVQNGQTRSQFLVRDVSGGGAARLGIGHHTADTSAFEIAPMHLAGPTQVAIAEIASIDAIGVEIGPVLSSAGHTLTDGTPVSVSVTNASGETHDRTGWLQDGRFQMVLPLSPQSAPFDVQITTPLDRETTQITEIKTPAAQIGGME